MSNFSLPIKCEVYLNFFFSHTVQNLCAIVINFKKFYFFIFFGETFTLSPLGSSPTSLCVLSGGVIISLHLPL